MLLTPPSPAERTILVAYAGASASGSLLGFEALKGLQAMDELVGTTAGEWLSVLCAALGALFALVILRNNFGRPGLVGAGGSIVSGVLATFLMGVIGGTLVLPLFGTMFGPWLILSTILTHPWLLMPWAMCLYGFHLARVEYDDEQATLFRFVQKIDGQSG